MPRPCVEKRFWPTTGLGIEEGSNPGPGSRITISNPRDSSQPTQTSIILLGSFLQPCCTAFARASISATSTSRSLPAAHPTDWTMLISPSTNGGIASIRPSRLFCSLRIKFLLSNSQCGSASAMRPHSISRQISQLLREVFDLARLLVNLNGKNVCGVQFFTSTFNSFTRANKVASDSRNSFSCCCKIARCGARLPVLSDIVGFVSAGGGGFGIFRDCPDAVSWTPHIAPENTTPPKNKNSRRSCLIASLPSFRLSRCAANQKPLR